MKNDKQDVENMVYEPKIKEKKKVSFVWIIPVIILFVLGWIAYESYTKKGTNIVVNFKNAEGLKKNATPLEYKGIQLGKVTNITMSDDLKSVNINILVNSDSAKYVANENSQFWIKKPRVSLTKISGLSTLIGGYKIELSPKKILKEEDFDELEEKYNFVGLDAKPINDISSQGYYVTLVANEENSVETGTPVFYNNFQIGEIISKDLKDDDLILKAYIYDGYKQHVNVSSKFVLNEALKVNYGPAGLSIKLGSVYSAIVGGITVVTEDKKAKAIEENEKYTLYSSKEDMKKKQEFSISFKTLDGIGDGTPIMYKGIKIGEILHVNLEKDNILAKAYLFEKYKYFLTNKTRFFVQKPKISMNGVKNLGNVIKGNFLSLKYSQGEFSNTFEVVDKDRLDISNEDILLTLYSKNLNSISKNSKVYYKNIQVGKVVDYALADSFDKVKIKISIDSKYGDILNDHTLFYDMSSKLVQIKNLNLSINYSGIEALLNGAIGIVTEKRNSNLNKNEFQLYSSYQDVQRLKRIYNKGFIITANFDNNFEIKKDMAIKYKNQEIGFVKNLKFNNKNSKVELVIYNSFKKYINKKSRFFKKSGLKISASLSGLLFEVSDFMSLLDGYISLDTSSPISYKNYQIFSSQDDMIASSQSIEIIFDDVEGLQKDFSKLKYKGVEIGKVVDLSLTKDHKIKLTSLSCKIIKVIIYECFKFYLVIFC